MVENTELKPQIDRKIHEFSMNQHELGSNLIGLMQELRAQSRSANVLFFTYAGAPHELRRMIEQNQPDAEIEDESDERFNASRRVDPAILKECFITTYDIVGGYHPHNNGSADLDAYYNGFLADGVKPLQPLNMEKLLRQTLNDCIVVER